MKIPWTLADLPLPAVTDIVCNYFAFECVVRNLAPDSIKGVYIPGVINLFTLNRLRLPPSFARQLMTAWLR